MSNHNRKKPLMRPRVPLYFCTYRDERGVEQIITYSQTLDPERARTWTGRHRVLMLEATVVHEPEEPPNG